MLTMLLTLVASLTIPPWSCDPACPPDADPYLCQAWSPCQVVLPPVRPAPQRDLLPIRPQDGHQWL